MMSGCNKAEKNPRTRCQPVLLEKFGLVTCYISLSHLDVGLMYVTIGYEWRLKNNEM